MNDAISAFSINVLLLLNKPLSRFQLSNPYDPFIKRILPKIKSEQITSLQFNTRPLCNNIEPDCLSSLREVTSVSFNHPAYYTQISRYIGCFSNLTRVSLYSDDRLDYEILKSALQQIGQKVKRFEIHCPKLVCTNDDSKKLGGRSTLTTRIEYFLLDVACYSSTSTNHRLKHDQSSSFMPIADLMRKMPNTRRIHIIGKTFDVERCLDEEQWKLVNMCPELEKIIVKVLRETSQDRRFFTRKAVEIQTMLRTTRPTITFQIRFL